VAKISARVACIDFSLHCSVLGAPVLASNFSQSKIQRSVFNFARIDDYKMQIASYRVFSQFSPRI